MLDSARLQQAMYFGDADAFLAAFPPEPTASSFGSGWEIQTHDGEKFPGGYGPTIELWIDYWALREKSAELFQRNLYGRSLIRRLVTNVINTGLALESLPAERILGLPEESLDEWTDDVETRWELWGSCKKLCDFHGQRTFAELQADAYREAIVGGDVLVVLRPDKKTGLPRVQLIRGEAVQDPPPHVAGEKDIQHGVELDSQGRHVAYWVMQDDLLTFERLPAYGTASGRRLAWLVYGSDKRIDEVRGQPILSAILQSLKELERYHDSALRKAVINSFVALFVTKKEEGPGSRAIGAGAQRVDAKTLKAGTSKELKFNATKLAPGIVADRLAVGEEIKGMDSAGTDEKLGEFTATIFSAAAACLEIPPEIARLSFNANYSASQAALNEFRMMLTPRRKYFGGAFCQPVYEDWLPSEVLAKRIKADGFLDAWRSEDAEDLYTFTAWTFASWAGHVKPTTDILKMAKGSELLVALGCYDFDTLSKETTGTKFRTNIRRQKRERELAAAAGVPLGLKSATGPAPTGQGPEEGEGSDDEDDEDDDKESN